ncbi:SdpA family antimicrobial peptide system protein [Pedobacter cryoconitis]|uniref:Antimicrobial peptide system SdpA family protein n=1 Tax=Pedobacter cryoconitis TaxID=188932 RepID=A0A327RTR3_9SPHI|nr:SdpA family antimicrobial peptide system protein [Pedobacter cryoconitis]RAJ19751.1 antimicrobial peptide system SdpA family protein [Pedobacter cryoconitis]
MNNNSKEVRITNTIRSVFGILILLGGLAIYSIMGSSMQSPFYISKWIKLNVSYFLPQGWAFFSKDAREEKIFAFKRRKDGSLERLSPSAASYRYLFGLNRIVRRLPMEYQFLLSQTDSASWIPSNYNIVEIGENSRTKKIVFKKNIFYKGICCGEIILIKARITPWAWSCER